jgi:hypothetical protein
LRTQPATTLGVSLLGSNGYRSFTGAYSQAPLNFVLIPDVQATHSFGRYELLAEGILPNNSANPFGSSRSRWSYISGGALANVGSKAVALGLGETVTNLAPFGLPPRVHSATRAQGLDLLAQVRFAPALQSEAYAFFKVEPYIHVFSYRSYSSNGPEEHSTTSSAHGARFDATLGRTLYLRSYSIDYGLRYINQTTNYASVGHRGAFLTRSTSLMPFIGLNVRP